MVDAESKILLTSGNNSCSVFITYLARHSRRWFEARRLPDVQEFGICLSRWEWQYTTSEIPSGWEQPGISCPPFTNTTHGDKSSVLTSGSHTLQLGSDSDKQTDSVNLSHSTKSTYTAASRVTTATYWITEASSSHFSAMPTMLNTNMQPLLCACWPLDLEVCEGNKQIFSQISRSTDNLLQYSTPLSALGCPISPCFVQLCVVYF